MEIGVVIGRFQVETLHEGHRYLINEAFDHHKKVIIFVGCAQVSGTKYDPLDYPARERMLRSEYPDAFILPIHDRLDDQEWSNELDRQIRTVVPNVKGARLYGGRDSFASHYKGAFTPTVVESGIQYMNGREQRDAIGRVVRTSGDFRAGIIYSTQNAWPYVKMCVDIAMVKLAKDMHLAQEHHILLGRKASENKWRLPGGAVDKGESLEQAASRELMEETCLSAELSNLEYLGSYPAGDWRYKNAGEIGLMTALFVTEYQFGAATGSDDLVEVKWHPLSSAEKEVVKNHKTLIAAVRRKYNVK
jgi:bifunctional NMN adenylyltransferase/nudix hydrolase